MREITITESKVKDAGLCQMDSREVMRLGGLTLADLAEETTYIVELPTGDTKTSGAKLFLCHQHLCDLGSAIINKFPMQDWNS